MRYLLIAALCLVAAPPRWPMTVRSTLGAGGLVLTKSADIRMRSEDLDISPKRVEVRYVFVNESGRDRSTRSSPFRCPIST